MKQRLGIAAALLPDPQLMILDEPTNGLDPAGIVEVRELLKALATDGRTVVVSSHLLGEIQAMVDYLVVIRFGVLLYAGSLEGLMEQATERVVVAPEFSRDVPRLVEVIEASGWSCQVSHDEVAIDIPAAQSADVERAVTAAGLTLRMLNPEADTLEAVFLRMTGATDAELSEQRRAQRQGNGA
jgi:ABC-2 type transport system ATP-binding protein